MNLKTFGEGMKKCVMGSNKDIILKVARRLFGTDCKIRKLGMHAVFSHPLGMSTKVAGKPWWNYEENQQSCSGAASGKYSGPS